MEAHSSPRLRRAARAASGALARRIPVVVLLAALSTPALAKKAPKPVSPVPVPTVVTPPGPVDPGKRSFPEPLPERPFVMPEVQRATLSNGLEVLLVRNDEVPLFDARLILKTGSWADPKGKEGLASVTFDMMDEGAAGKSAAELERELKKLGGSVGAGAGSDSASVAVSGPTDTFPQLLRILADVLLRPDFPEADWDLKRTKRIADLKASLEDPNVVAGRALMKLVYADAYRGRLDSEAAYAKITTKDMRRLHGAAVRPDQAVLLLGGDLALADVVPVLEATLGTFGAKGKGAKPVAAPALVPAASEVVYLIDKPGAAQTVLTAYTPVGSRTSPDYWDLFVANTALGVFTGRLNLNLREDKGWTYGARCGLDDNLGATLWTCSTGVQADKSIPALLELRKEIAGPSTERPFTADEIAYFKGYRANAFPARYETPGALLGGLADIWRYDLPADWLERYVPGVEASTAERANAAFAHWVQPAHVAYLVVGDATKVREQLAAEPAAKDLKVVALDRDARPLPTPALPTPE